MLFKNLFFLAPLLLTQVSSLPTTALEKKEVSVTYNPGGLNIGASGTPFIAFGSVDFYFQNSDSNFVVYVNSVPKWNAGVNPPHSCAAPNTCELVFQYDGNFVRYVNGVATWNSQTAGTGHTLIFNSQAPFIVVQSSTGKALWSS